MTKKITDPAAIREFALAGNAYFTLVSTKTQTRFTYRVSQPEDNKAIWFVSVLAGSDNTGDYSYLGFFRSGARFFEVGRKSRIAATAPSARAVKWFLDRVLNPAANDASLAQVEFWHMNRCARCARPLTVPASIASGFGPECITKVGGGFFAEGVEAPKAPRIAPHPQAVVAKAALEARDEAIAIAERDAYRAKAPAAWRTPRQEAAALNSAPRPDRVKVREVQSKKRGALTIRKAEYDRPFDDELPECFLAS